MQLYMVINEDEPEKQVKMKCMYDENRILTIKIIDEGIGIKNIDKAITTTVYVKAADGKVWNGIFVYAGIYGQSCC